MSGSEKGDAAVPPARAEARSPSPGTKRAASEVDQDTEMALGSSAQASQSRSDTHDSMDVTKADDDDDFSGQTQDGTNGSDNIYPTPSSMATYTAPSATRTHTMAEASVEPSDRPSYDDQVAKVTGMVMQPLTEKQKGYVVSMAWLKRVLARSSTRADQADKTAAEGEVGKVDNSDLVLVTDPANVGLKDEAGEPFVPLRPGLQLTEDFEIVPEEAWDLIMQWYGLAEQSPTIVRYAHNTTPTGQGDNIQYEINPPIFTILKLPNPSAGMTSQALKEKSMKPARVLSSRHTNFQKWLKEAKGLANISMSTKVRVWRILGGLGSAAGSTAITPAASRSNSPAPAASAVANGGNNLVLDQNTFLSLSEGAQRELLDDAKDQTNNENYNGKSTLDFVGLGGSDVIVLEEQVPGGTWASLVSKHTLSRLGVGQTPGSSLKNGVTSKLKNSKTGTDSGRTSPAPEPVVRGRRKDGKPRGNTGLSNLGNTCYMNSALQCVRSVEELTFYFLSEKYKQDLNPSNPLAHNGEVAKAYANLLRMIYDETGQASFAPRQLKNTIGRYGPAFSGYGQQDSQEFLLFLLDGLQEDLNRIQKKPYIEKPDSTDEMTHNKAALTEFADKCWDIYKARNDSVVTDLFAGMYKSTLHCPVCEKVSIIFDPFNNLTLQLPIENVWSKDIFYFPLNQKPVRIDVEIDKNASIKSLKEMVAKKMGSDPQKLIMSEIYKRKFYKMFDNVSSIAETQITANDEIGIFEVDSAPTNYNPDKAPRGYFGFNRSDQEETPKFDSPKADRILVPIFNRVIKARSNNPRNSQRQLFGVPMYVVLTREEACSYDAVLRKILSKVNTMTTRDFLNEEAPADENDQDGNNEDSDTVVMNDDDAGSDSKIKTASVDGEEGMVDVSMRDASDNSDKSSDKHHSSGFHSTIPSRFRDLFEVTLMRSGEPIPLGWSNLDDNKDYPKMSFRIKTKPATQQPDEGQDGSGDSGSDSSSDGLNTPSRTSAFTGHVQAQPFVRPGEGFVLDWNDQAYDALFSGDDKDPDALRGAPTWDNVDKVSDPELTKRRQLRQTRKKKGVTLNECLDEFNKEEVLSENDAWYCPRCKEHRRASKKFELWKTPDILVMHLKRFSASRTFRDKLDLFVDFPVEGLDMTGRVECPEEGKSQIYDLFAVDNHYGGLGGGHYTAYAKNFYTGTWNEYNDSSVSRPLDPQSVVTSSAYLLFYRRRSDRPLGGKVLEEIHEASTRAVSDESPSESRDQSPSGEGRRLDDSSRNGSSSVLAGVGAAHQPGDGGLQAGTHAKGASDDSPPEYSNSPTSGEKSLAGTNRQEGMNFDEADFFGDGGFPTNPFHYQEQPSWSFDRVTDAYHYGPSQMTTTAPAGSISDNEDLIDDDDASNKAVGGGDLSDNEISFHHWMDSPGPGPQGPYPGTPTNEPIQNISVLDPALDDDDDDEDGGLPIAELHAPDEKEN